MSLIEAMVAVAIVLVISALTFQVLRASVDIRDVLAEQDEITRAGRVTMAKLRRQLQLAFLTEHAQAVNSYQTVFVGLDENPDRLYFASLSHQRLYRDSRESDQTEITVWAEPARTDRSRGHILYHRQAPRIDEEPGVGGQVYPLAYNVRAFNLRYLDGRTGEWTDRWDSRSVDQANRLPRAVQIGLVLIAQDSQDRNRTRDVPFLTTVVLEYGEPLNHALIGVPSMPQGGGQGGQGGGRVRPGAGGGPIGPGGRPGGGGGGR